MSVGMQSMPVTTTLAKYLPAIAIAVHFPCLVVIEAFRNRTAANETLVRRSLLPLAVAIAVRTHPLLHPVVAYFNTIESTEERRLALAALRCPSAREFIIALASVHLALLDGIEASPR